MMKNYSCQHFIHQPVQEKMKVKEPSGVLQRPNYTLRGGERGARSAQRWRWRRRWRRRTAASLHPDALMSCFSFPAF